MRNAVLVGSLAKPASGRGSASPVRVTAGCRAAAALALLAAGCGSDDVRSPTAPTAPDPVERSLVGIEIVNVPPAGLTIGYTVRLEVHGTYSDGAKRIEVAAWTSSDPGVASVDAGGAVRGHAASSSTTAASPTRSRAAPATPTSPSAPSAYGGRHGQRRRSITVE